MRELEILKIYVCNKYKTNDGATAVNVEFDGGHVVHIHIIENYTSSNVMEFGAVEEECKETCRFMAMRAARAAEWFIATGAIIK